jgi:hypothetical protein
MKCFKNKGRAEENEMLKKKRRARSPQLGLEVDNFKPRLKS